MENGRAKRLKKNTISSLSFRILSIVIGLILPRIYLLYYGSEINGMVNSITQFLVFISMFELGVGAVVESALYKPLAEKDLYTVSCIVKSAKKFYTTIARILVVYVITLMFILPRLKSFPTSHFTTIFLIFAISISSFANYYFGLVNFILLNADQKGYIQYNVQIVTLILNAGISIALITHGVDISIVKILSSCVFLIRPIYLLFYVRKNYVIDADVIYEKEPLSQKWNGVAQHVANIVLENTDVIVLTLFSSLSNVSIYSIYHLIVSSIERIFSALTSGVVALWGELWAKDEKNKLTKQFELTEWAIHNLVIFLYGCSFVLMPSFVRQYTIGITDADYSQPIFSMLLCLAYLVRCLERPYTTLMFAANKFRETQLCYFITAFINVFISIVVVKGYGLIGVAIGTLVALAYQLIWMIWFAYKELLHIDLRQLLKIWCMDIISFFLCTWFSAHVSIEVNSYISWISFALIIAVIWIFVLVGLNWIMFRRNINIIIKRIVNVRKH